VIRLLAKLKLPILLSAAALALAAPSAHAFDLILHPSAVVKALKAQVFKDKGRYYLQKPDRCNNPYLENPTVSFKGGRVYVGAHLAGRIGAMIGGVCQSAAESSAIMLSARPAARSRELALEDVRLEAAGKPMVAAALQNLIGANSLSALRIDLLEAIGPLTQPDKTIPYAVVVRTLELTNLVVQNEELHVTVGGVVEVR
jgi:hypothetical protein